MMPHLSIRQLEADELITVVAPMMQYAFSPSPQTINPDDWGWLIDPARPHHVHVLFEDDEAAASAAFTAMRHNLRGHVHDTAAVWGVATEPMARRKGYAKQVIQHAMQHMHQQGYVTTTLYAFRESFYERMGYVTWPMPLEVTIKPERLAVLLRMDTPGHIERLRFRESGYSIYKDYMGRVRARTHGLIFNEEWVATPSRINKDLWTAVARRDGEVVGLFHYEMTGEDGDTMKIHPFYYDDAAARTLLLKWIALHVDQVDDVNFWRLPPGSHPETWVADLYPEVKAFEPALSRVLNVARLDGLPIAARAGRFTAQITDDLCAWNNGVFTFESGEDGVLSVSPGETADCTLSIAALSALLYGVRDPDEFHVRGWGDPSPQTQTVMRAMFPAALPYADATF